jgi:hypothetical protein
MNNSKSITAGNVSVKSVADNGYSIACVIVAAICLALTTSLSAQDRKYVMWYSPSNATEVYGVMLDVFPREESFPHYAVYGVELNINPLGLFVPPILVFQSLDPAMHRVEGTVESLERKDFSDYQKIIYGLQAGTMNVAEPYIIYGLDLSLVGSFESIVNGMSISLVMNKQDIVNGLTVAVIGNHNIRCRGVQAGLINTCSDLKGIQIGIWNVNQKRKLPLINWNFKRTVKKAMNE